MDIAFELACEALRCNEVPVGCAFVYNGEVIASGRNEVNATRDATQHAEMVTIRRLEQWCRNNQKELDKILVECDLFVTVEPCIMCAAAIRFCLPAHLKSITYGARNERFGGCGSVLSVHNSPSAVAPLNCISGVEAEAAVELLKKFYAQENENAPEELRKRKRVM
ncbi:cytidine/deoxycytidylate deaminase-related [Schistosoma mansoni]|uniref:Cytidine/deoxycytidylate deaminase-related n=1 Tax=Schistosoma mansoni TaxID=6183 RepID=G4VHS5_SCHMA|nr:cytidine/deoxycytidylate deaminase-related [Schistosoma mansoni]|eukprot:XP_018652541.1 cytidine/deoxycytidylate deaminase-related [Schistosoma mansoni]